MVPPSGFLDRDRSDPPLGRWVKDDDPTDRVDGAGEPPPLVLQGDTTSLPVPDEVQPVDLRVRRTGRKKVDEFVPRSHDVMWPIAEDAPRTASRFADVAAARERYFGAVVRPQHDELAAFLELPAEGVGPSESHPDVGVSILRRIASLKVQV